MFILRKEGIYVRDTTLQNCDNKGVLYHNFLIFTQQYQVQDVENNVFVDKREIE